MWSRPVCASASISAILRAVGLLRQGQVVHEPANVGIQRVAGGSRPGVGALLRLDDRVMPHQRLVIFGDVDIEF